MDSYQRLIEGLPAHVVPGASRHISEKEVRRAAAALPWADPCQAAREVELILDDMLPAAWAGGERIAVLEHLRAPVESVCAGIERQLGVEPHPASEAGVSQGEVAQRLQGKLACSYALGLHELCAPAGKLPRFKGKSAALAAVFALVHADQALLWAYRRYQSPPTCTWRRVHALHAFADELGVADQAVSDTLAGGVPLTARLAYTRILLLAMSNPYRFSARDLQDARQIICGVAKHCALGRAGGQGIAIDVDSDTRPGKVSAARIATGFGILMLDVAPAQRFIDQRMAVVPQGTDTIDLPKADGGYLTTSVRLLARLRAGWGMAPRGHARLAAGHALDIVAGMHALHYVLAGNKEFAAFVREVDGNASRRDAHVSRSPWRPTADASRPRIFRGEVLDQSEGGYRMRLRAANGLRVRIGEPVGLAPVEDEAEDRDWMVGVIRWLRHEGDQQWLGVELLRRGARAAGLRPVTADGEALAPLRAVELPGGQDGDRLSLLVSHRLGRDVVAAEVMLPALASDWSSRASIATWRPGATEVLGPACFRIALERDTATELE